jgi:UDP-N-acetyl-D-mannosaminuronic acid dehydrogenase
MNFKKMLLVEPNINQMPKGFKPTEKITPMTEALELADIVVLLVDHVQFKTMDLNILSGKQIVDTRGIWS